MALGSFGNIGKVSIYGGGGGLDPESVASDVKSGLSDAKIRDAQLGAEVGTAIEGFRGELEAQKQVIGEATDPATITAPIREAFDNASSRIQETATAEARLANEQIRAFEQESNDPRAAARFATRRRATSALVNDIAGVTAQVQTNFGEQMSQAMLSAGQLRTQGSAAILENSQRLASLIGDFNLQRANLMLNRQDSAEKTLASLAGIAANLEIAKLNRRKSSSASAGGSALDRLRASHKGLGGDGGDMRLVPVSTGREPTAPHGGAGIQFEYRSTEQLRKAGAVQG